VQRNDRVSNIVLIVGMVCATIIILASMFDRFFTSVAMREVPVTTPKQADNIVPMTQEQAHPLRKKVSNE
jgi:hypothetical protein